MKISLKKILLGFGFMMTLGNMQASANDKTKIVFWHEMTGPAQEQLVEFANEFNKSQDKYEVDPEFEGNYNDAVQKILNTHGTSASPALYQSMDISTAQMYHSKFTTPMQEFVDEDKSYDLNKMSDIARAFYSKDGKLLAMPFNTSQPVLYYNATMLKKYNITPPPVSPSYSDITRVAKQIYEKSGHKIKGLSVESYGWFFEQFMANSGESLANNDNGHLKTPTKVNFTSPGIVEAMKWIQENVKAGDFENFGSGGNAGSNEMAAFLAGKLGIFLQSSGDISQLLSGTKDKLGITYYPHPDNKKANGVSIGGAALWINNDKSKDVQKGAFEFTKYLVSAKSQARWQKATGYLALNKDSQKEEVLKELFEKNPATKIASQQLQDAKPNKTNSGIFMEGLIQERTLTQTAMQKIANGDNIKDALDVAENSMNKFVEDSNRANGY